jgi:delta 1-pyrroline-5-carboxylate dehydrogenase
MAGYGATDLAGGTLELGVPGQRLPSPYRAEVDIASAFRSAGQRCSALRLLYVHEAIADDLLAMLSGAIAELVIGDPADPSTDVGPVIDAVAYRRLETQISSLNAKGRLLTRAVPAAALRGNCIAPCVYEITAVEVASEEIFGPVLQVVRWSGEAERLVERINALGYGLTLGVHTRVDGRAESIARCARIGNVYVNRNMVGAVVGVQPFGGEGLSGTGPKAGGGRTTCRGSASSRPSPRTLPPLAVTLRCCPWPLTRSQGALKRR